MTENVPFYVPMGTAYILLIEFLGKKMVLQILNHINKFTLSPSIVSGL